VPFRSGDKELVPVQKIQFLAKLAGKIFEDELQRQKEWECY